ncbi:tetratricopeptide repeat protein [Myxococcota bacterium]|nr:tetratricopeptide repeat protein [Myxococcota bacterium]
MLWRVVTRWRLLWDDDVTGADLHLARQASFFVLVPPTVLLHEAGHALAVQLLGGEILGFGFLGYIGWVVSRPMGPPEDFWVGLSGNLVTLAIAIASVAFALRRPGHPVRNVLFAELGRQSLVIGLVVYPLLSLAGHEGDFAIVYDFRATPIESSVTAVVHAALVITWLWGWSRHVEPRLALLGSPLSKRLVEAEARVARDPSDLVAHRELGLLLFTAGDHTRARPHLERAVTGGRADARTKLALGTALVESGAHTRAADVLAEALDGLLRPEDRRLAELPRARALVALGRIDEARGILDGLARRFPRDAEVAALRARLPKHDRPE